MDKLASYYAGRAAEYERIYARPERQAELATLRARIRKIFAKKTVLELACGTGYWTEVIAGGAAHVTALDINEEVLAVARAKNIPSDKATFRIGSAYDKSDAAEGCNALFAGFWWSHVPLAQMDGFLKGTVSSIAPGGLIAFVDNRYVEGSSTSISRRDAQGNTYQLRKLDDGSTHEVLKNFP
ncbi:MAG: class I SAM-dependent methyltransferase, partial [Burkholderiales bacterium]